MNYKKTVLKNGSTLIVIKIPKSLSTTFMILSKSGPRFDPKDKSGLSHFTEHVLFKGTKKYKNSEVLSRTLENYGAMAEGFSYFETNTYTVKIPKENLPIAVDILIDQMQNSLLRIEDIEIEKGVVSEEYNMSKSNPSEYIWELWSKNIWKNNDLGRAYIGTLESINSFEKNDVREFLKNNYFPDGTVYVVAGDIEINNIKTLINRKLSIKKQLKTRYGDQIKIVRSNPIMIENSNTDSITINYGFLTTNRQNNDSHVLELLEYLLGRGLGSRFNQTVVQKGLTYYVMTHTQHLSDTGYFLTNFTSQKKNLNRILEIINEQLMEIKAGKFTYDEFKRAKAYYVGQLLINNETTDALANWYGYQAINNIKTILTIEEKQKIINKISKNDIIIVANKYFNINNWYLSAIGPIEKKDIRIVL